MVAARGETATERGCVVRRSGGGAVRSVAASWGVVLREVNGGWGWGCRHGREGGLAVVIARYATSRRARHRRLSTTARAPHLTTRPLLALLARAAQQHVMVLDANAEAPGEVVDRPFEAGVVEGHEAPALAADQVVMMGSAGVDGFEP